MDERRIHRSSWRGMTIEVSEDSCFRTLRFGSRFKQSRMDLYDPDRLVLPYTRQMMSGALFQPTPKRVLLIGLGGGSLVRFLRRHYPDCHLDVVEISQEVVRIAERYFNVRADGRTTLHVADGAWFVQERVARLAVEQERVGGVEEACRYDMVFLDAYDSRGMSASAYALNLFQATRGLLTPQGVLIANATSSDKDLYRMICRAMERAFRGNLLRFPSDRTYNVILLGFPGARPDLSSNPLYRQRAETLAQDHCVEYPEFIETIIRNNRSFWRVLEAWSRLDFGNQSAAS
ncbi:MAG: hypothetical protein HQL50_08735 [Magnetococcales bacterium]|nr:hypothetical protein [Magnetococcales bacterium]